MNLRVLDEVIDMGAHGVGLLCLEGEPREGMRIRDARGRCTRWAASPGRRVST